MKSVKEVCIEAPRISPVTHAFVFDCDDTLLTNRLSNKIWLIAKNVLVIVGALLKHPKLSYRLIKNTLFDTAPACAEQWRELFKQLGTPGSLEYRFATFIQTWARMKTVIPGMEKLLQELHDAGYRMSMWTDMGCNDDAFYAHQYKNLYTLFTFRMAVNYSGSVEPIKKPSPESVTAFIRKHEKYTKDKTIIFIDDRLVNCLAAHTYGGLDYIHFKSVQQLQNILQEKKALKHE